MPFLQRLSIRNKLRPLFHYAMLIAFAVLLIVAIAIALTLHRYIFKTNINISSGQTVSIYIPTGSDYDDVKKILYLKGLIINRRSFEWISGRKSYTGNVKPGHYVLKAGMSNNELVNMLRSGDQTPVRVIFNNIRLKEDLAGRISFQIEADSAALMQCWNDNGFLRTIETTPELITTYFIPNTYEIWWNTDAYEFTRRMYREFKAFWNPERIEKSSKIRLSIQQVIILASIVEKETQQNDERPVIAGVYLNRLNKKWPLQADPTLVFASGDFSLKRVLDKHKEIDSPYNTYKYPGLPPGPICLPSISSIDAVLNARKHDYMFFCARDDLSGYHVFSRTLSEHNRHARAYQQALNRNKVR